MESFIRGRIGIDLTLEIIAHDKTVQTLLDQEKIPWGVQYELARGVSAGIWEWSDVMPKINSLRASDGNIKIAYKVRSIMLDRPMMHVSDLAIW